MSRRPKTPEDYAAPVSEAFRVFRETCEREGLELPHGAALTLIYGEGCAPLEEWPDLAESPIIANFVTGCRTAAYQAIGHVAAGYREAGTLDAEGNAHAPTEAPPGKVWH